MVTDRKLAVDDGTGGVDYYVADVSSQSDYFPFGMVLPNRNDPGSSDYRYSFQGQEKDDEVKGEGNSINYKYRMHDPRVGRFFAVDPLAYKFPYYSPYHFSSNSPIMAVELEGLESSIQINYVEGSITITRIHGQMKVSQDMLNDIPGHWEISSGNNTQDLSPGGQYEVWCADCNDSYRQSGSWVLIQIPALQVVRTKEVENEVVETFDVPGSDPEYDTESDNITYPASKGDGSDGHVGRKDVPVSDPNILSTPELAITTSIGKIDDIEDGDPKVSTSVTSIVILLHPKYASREDEVRKMANKYSKNVTVKVTDEGFDPNPRHSAFAYVTVNYDITTRTSDGTPDTTRTETRTETTTETETLSPLQISWE